MPVDVSSRASVQSLAHAAAALGRVVQVAHIAGLSPNMASPASILAVDLLGVAIVLEEFGHVIANDGSGVIIASMAGHMLPSLPSSHCDALARTPVNDLLQLAFLQPEFIPDSAMAYAMSKRANHLRVQAASIDWGARCARINSKFPVSLRRRWRSTRWILRPVRSCERSSPPRRQNAWARPEKSRRRRPFSLDQIRASSAVATCSSTVVS